MSSLTSATEENPYGSIRKTRLEFIDVMRGLALAGALADHALRSFDVLSQLPFPVKVVTSLFFRACTPAFFLLFGVMLELVYYRKMRAEGARVITSRLLHRSWQCYLGYALVVVARWIAGAPWTNSLQALFLLESSGTADVLKFYSAALLLSGAVLKLRDRFGPQVLVLGVLLIWGFSPFLDHVSWPELHSPAAHLTGLLFGRPFGASFYSVYHGLTIVLIGMLLGRAISDFPTSGLQPFHRAGLGVVAACVAVVVISLTVMSMPALVEGFQGAMFRRMHHPVYYAFNLAMAVLGAVALSAWIPPGAPVRRMAFLSEFGKRSLVGFTLGSVLLVLVPARLYFPPAVGLLGVASFMVLAWAGTMAVSRQELWSQTAEFRGSVVRWVRSF